MTFEQLPSSVELKVDLMFRGLRYTDALGRAAERAFPNFFPHRFAASEHDPTGTGKTAIPYIVVTPDDTHCRIKTNCDSPWWISGSYEHGFQIHNDETRAAMPIAFEPAQQWMTGVTRDGTPRAQAGLTLHGDMAVVNVAPGCEYFLAGKRDGVSMRCTFCTYGSPDMRLKHLGQVMGRTEIPDETYDRLAEVLTAALAEAPIRTIYLVGGSLTDPREEGRRFIELARRVQRVNRRRIPLTCGSGALPDESLQILREEELVDSICFNLEVWSAPLFRRICPGKDRYVGYDRWIAALEKAVSLWGPGRIYSAMVAGIELTPELALDAENALDIAVQGAADLCGRGILPIYSLYWPPPGRDLSEHLRALRDFFARLQLAYHDIRRRHGVDIWEGFLTHRGAYMQIECDLDRAATSAS
jgi:hypothetical protein